METNVQKKKFIVARAKKCPGPPAYNGRRR